MKRVAVLLVILFCSDIFAQFGELSEIAVFVRGDLNKAGEDELGQRMLDAFAKSGRFATKTYLWLIEGNASFDDNTVLTFIKRRPVIQYVCIVDVKSAFGSHQISTRVLKVETAEVGLIGNVSGFLNDKQSFRTISVNAVNKMLGMSVPVPVQSSTVQPVASSSVHHANAPAVQVQNFTKEERTEKRKKEPCPFDWLGIVGMPFAYGGGATMVYGLATWSDDDGAVFYYGLASAGTGLLIGLIADLANLPCKQRQKDARNASIGSFGDVGCMVVDHVQMAVSPDGKQGYAGLKFDF